MKKKQTKIIIKFDKHGMIDTKIINASDEQLIQASNFLIGKCLSSKPHNRTGTLAVRTHSRKHKKQNKIKKVLHKIYRCFLKVAKLIFEEQIKHADMLLNNSAQG